jgi:cold shock CspA family protein
VQKDLGDQPARLGKLRQAVESDSASPIARYLLARAYRDQGIPLKTIETLNPIIKNDFKDVRAYVEYTRAMLETGETFKKSAATLSVCKMEGETDSSFIGLYGGLLYIDGKYGEAQKLWEDARELNFSDEERTRRQFVPRDPETQQKLKFNGVVMVAKPSFVLIQHDDGQMVISKMTVVGGKVLEKNQKVEFELSFSAKSPLAENLRLVS